MKKKKPLKRLILLLLAVLILAGAAYIGYDYGVAPRLESSRLVFEPFSGKLFNVNPKSIVFAWLVRPGKENLEYRRDISGRNGPARITKFAEALNNYRYSFWLPCGWNPMGSWTPMGSEAGEIASFNLSFSDGDDLYRCFFDENRIWVGRLWNNLEKGKEPVRWVEGAWYYGGRDLYDALMALE